MQEDNGKNVQPKYCCRIHDKILIYKKCNTHTYNTSVYQYD